jgi:hypothetical protein
MAFYKIGAQPGSWLEMFWDAYESGRKEPLRDIKKQIEPRFPLV